MKKTIRNYFQKVEKKIEGSSSETENEKTILNSPTKPKDKTEKDESPMSNGPEVEGEGKNTPGGSSSRKSNAHDISPSESSDESSKIQAKTDDTTLSAVDISKIEKTTPKCKKKSVTMKDYVTSTPTGTNSKHSAPNITENIGSTQNVDEVINLSENRENGLFLDDLSDDDEIFVIQCPHGLNYTSLENKSISLEGESLLKLKNGEDTESFECYAEKDNMGRMLNIIFPSYATRSFSIGTFPLAGSLLLAESVELPEVGEIQVEPWSKIPLPEKIGRFYDETPTEQCKRKRSRGTSESSIESKKIKTEMRELKRKRSRETSESSFECKKIKTETPEPSRKKKKHNHEEVEQTPEIILQNGIINVKEEDIDISGNESIEKKKKKKKKKSQVEPTPEMILENSEINVKEEEIELSVDDSLEKRKKKKKKKSQAEPEMIPENSEIDVKDEMDVSVDDSIEKKKKKKKKKKKEYEEGSSN